MSSVDTGEAPTPTLDHPVERWNRQQFERLGFDADTAVLLVGDGLDYHDVEALTDRGCDRELALRIVR